MTILQYVEAHPWWTFVWLCLICPTLVGCASLLRGFITVNSGMNSGQINQRKD